MALYPAPGTPPSFTSGEFPPSAKFNTYRDMVGYLINPPHVSARHNTTQSISNATWSAVVFNTEDEDNSGFHSTSSNTDRFVIPVSGLYLVTAEIEFAANATGQRLLGFQRNGTPSAGPNLKGRNSNIGSSGTYGAECVASAVNKLASGDIVRVLCWQDSGGSLNIVANTGEMNPYVTLTWLGTGN